LILGMNSDGALKPQLPDIDVVFVGAPESRDTDWHEFGLSSSQFAAGEVKGES